MESLAQETHAARCVWQADRRHVLHPWQHFESFREEGALLLEKGDGAYVWDVDGRRYLDAVGGLWCTNIGLGRTEIADAIAGQVGQLAFANSFVDMGSVSAAELAETVAALAPADINRTIFSTGGSTAVDTAVRLAHFYQFCRGKPAKRHLISRQQAYHGSTYMAASLTGRDRIPEFEYETGVIHFVSCPNHYRAPDNMTEGQFCDFLVEELERKILELEPENVSAFFAEPVMGAGGVIVPPPGYNKRTWQLCRDYDVLYVADEVVTGFGRLGHWFASKGEFDVEPDIITCAKGITAGYLPLGATLYSDRIHEVISSGDPARFFGHGFTYGGHPVSCAAALKVIEIMQREDVLASARKVGGYFESRLRELEDLAIVGDVRGRRFMMCVEFVADKGTRELFPEELNIGKLVSNQCEKLGLLVRPLGNLNIMSPTLTLTREQVDFIVDTLRRGIENTARELA
ncbi:MAG: aminotransferase [Gammaproteobacteria bacterium]|nr:aminotransferase [Gammaproteobacteria bacterium]